MEGGLATFVLQPAFVLSLFVGAFHTCIYIFVRGNLGWHIPGVLVGGVLGALLGQAIGSRVGDLLYIGEYSLLWASLMAWVGVGMAIVVSTLGSRRPEGTVDEPGEIRPRR
jgi:uncharacterized membrane protein